MKKIFLAIIILGSFFLGTSIYKINIIKPAFAAADPGPGGGNIGVTTEKDIKLNFGSVAEEKALPGAEGYDPEDIGAGFGTLMGTILRIVVTVAAFILFIYLLWGGLGWITAGGDKSKIETARNRITQSIIGMIVLAGTIALFAIMQSALNFQVFNFIGGTTYSGGANTGGSGDSSGGGSSGGSGGGDQNCIDNGELLNTGTNTPYCTTGAAMVRCYPPEGNFTQYHYEPCYCVEGSSYQDPDFTFRSCN